MNTAIWVALIALGSPALLAAGAIINSFLVHRFGRVVKLQNGQASVLVEEVRDRHSFAVDQATLIGTLSTQCTRLQERVDSLTERNATNTEKIAVLTGTVENHTLTIGRMEGEAVRYKLECEETIKRLTDEGAILREQNSTLITENGKLASAIKLLGGDIKEVLTPTRRSEDKKNA